ncbi:putative zinc finger CCCH domain-containing protein 5 isoform [Sesbania bispinosa]|nr:putative zinc finger CCCH domain-containing protein 5 isoform [Sesbania bispinosa]
MEGCHMWRVYEIRFQDLFSWNSLQFYHCFRNPGGDYEWANSDKPPPKYWVKKMAALFGYSDDYEALRERENLSMLKNSINMSKQILTGVFSLIVPHSVTCNGFIWLLDKLRTYGKSRKFVVIFLMMKDRTVFVVGVVKRECCDEITADNYDFDKMLTFLTLYHSRRSRSREIDQLNSGHPGRRKQEDQRKQELVDEEWNANLKDNHKRKCGDRTPDADSDREWLEEEQDREKHHESTRKSSFNRTKDNDGRSHEEDSDVDWATITRDNEMQQGREEERNPRKWNSDRNRKGTVLNKGKAQDIRAGTTVYVTGDSESDEDGGEMETRHGYSRKARDTEDLVFRITVMTMRMKMTKLMEVGLGGRMADEHMIIERN